MSSRPEPSLCHQVWGHRQEYHPDLRQGLDRLGCILLDSCTGEHSTTIAYQHPRAKLSYLVVTFSARHPLHFGPVLRLPA